MSEPQQLKPRMWVRSHGKRLVTIIREGPRLTLQRRNTQWGIEKRGPEKEDLEDEGGWVGSQNTKEESVRRGQCSATWMLMRIQVTQETNCVHGLVTLGYWVPVPGNSQTRAGWEMSGRSISEDRDHWRQQHLPELTSPAAQALFREFLPVTHCEYNLVLAVWKIIPHPDSSARMVNCLCPVQGMKLFYFFRIWSEYSPIVSSK